MQDQEETKRLMRKIRDKYDDIWAEKTASMSDADIRAKLEEAKEMMFWFSMLGMEYFDIDDPSKMNAKQFVIDRIQVIKDANSSFLDD